MTIPSSFTINTIPTHRHPTWYHIFYDRLQQMTVMWIATRKRRSVIKRIVHLFGSRSNWFFERIGAFSEFQDLFGEGLGVHEWGRRSRRKWEEFIIINIYAYFVVIYKQKTKEKMIHDKSAYHFCLKNKTSITIVFQNAFTIDNHKSWISFTIILNMCFYFV